MTTDEYEVRFLTSYKGRKWFLQSRSTLCSAGSNPATSTNLKLNKMSKIIKVKEQADYSVRTEFSKDLGMFKVIGIVWSCVSEIQNVYDNDITEIELMFILNGKVCKYLGFKELYEKLYGEKTFNQFYADLSTEFEQAYFKQTPYKNK